MLRTDTSTPAPASLRSRWFGFDASKIDAVAKGGSTPVTKSGDRKGNKPSPKPIACLQPDRRVETEVIGTR